MFIWSLTILSTSYVENNNIFNLIYYSYFDEQYIYLCLYFLSSLVLTLLLFSIAFFLSPKQLSFEKSSSYECGFEPFGSGHLIFNIQFFIVGILFMIFDLELAYIFPWIFNLGSLSIFCYFLMSFFLILLIIGFVYEWKKGALDWI
jgi:NADH:ubiquinone oxidoreductase subunit 3 (subunit A)